MIFEFYRSTLLSVLSFHNKLIKFLDPFGNYSENAWSFDEKHSILNLHVSVFWSIFGYLPPNGIGRVGFYLFSVLTFGGVDISAGWLIHVINITLFLGKINLLKNITHDLLELPKLLFRFVNHKIKGFHDARRIVFVLSQLERNFV